MNETIQLGIPRGKWVVMQYVQSFANKAHMPEMAGPYLGIAEGNKWLWGGGPSYMGLPENAELVAVYSGIDIDDYPTAYITFCKQFPILAEDPPRSGENAWVDPDGRWFPTPFKEHRGYGKALLAQEYGEYGDWQDLMGKGWIAFDASGHTLGNAEMGFSGKLSKAQVLLIDRLQKQSDNKDWRMNMESALYRDWDARGRHGSWPDTPEG